MSRCHHTLKAGPSLLGICLLLLLPLRAVAQAPMPEPPGPQVIPATVEQASTYQPQSTETPWEVVSARVPQGGMGEEFSPVSEVVLDTLEPSAGPLPRTATDPARGITVNPTPPDPGTLAEPAGEATAGVPQPEAEKLPNQILPRPTPLEKLLSGTLEPSRDEVSAFTFFIDGDSSTGASSNLQGALRASKALSELSEADLQSVLEKHRVRRSEYETQQLRDKALVEKYSRQAEYLRALLDNSLDLEVEARELFSIDLQDAFLMASIEKALKAGAGSPEDKGSDGTGNPARHKADELAALLVAVAEMPGEERARLLERHRRRQEVFAGRKAETVEPEAPSQEQAAPPEPQVEAEAAGAAVEGSQENEASAQGMAESTQLAAQAELAAQLAAQQAAAAERAAAEEKDRNLKRGAEAKARLLSVGEAMSRYESQLHQRRAAAHSRELDAGVRSAAIEEVKLKLLHDEAGEGEADAYWNELWSQLSYQRIHLRKVLGHMAADATEVPQLPERMDLSGVPEGLRAEVEKLRAGLEDRALAIRELEKTVLKAEVETQIHVVTVLNRARLELLEIVSEGLREELTGFGQVGVEQVIGALDQGVQVARYRLLTWPARLGQLQEIARTAPSRIIISGIWLLLGALVFFWWLFRSDRWFDSLATRLGHSREGRVRRNRFALSLLWYFRRVRLPLEWLLFLGLVYSFLSRGLPEISILWLVFQWMLVGLLVVRILDAMAARNQARRRMSVDSSTLRYRSLRLVGMTVVISGLTTSLAEELLGRGVIYRWLVRTLWILSIPLVLVLVRWWAATIRRRLEAQPSRNRFISWALEHSTGLKGWAASAAGGFYLLIDGMYRWMMTLISALPFARRLHGYLFRREVSRLSAKQQGAAGGGAPDPAVLAALDPDQEVELLVPSSWNAEMQRLLDLVNGSSGNLAAVVGERGIGKSSFLKLAASRFPEAEVLYFGCERIPVSETLAVLQARVGLGEQAGHQELLARIDGSPLKLIIIDDAQRLVRPEVGGFEALDSILALVRGAGEKTSWIFAFGTPAWQFVQRARSERFLFDLVISLRSWSEGDISTLIERRLAPTGCEISFESLLNNPDLDAEILDGEERKTETWFYRLLSDYARGNPAVAMHFFGHSLRQKEPGHLDVRLFETPKLLEMDSLSLNLLFLLRAIVQLEIAPLEQIASATGLHDEIVRDGTRLLTLRGYVERKDEMLRVSWHWYSAITSTLVRQHLMEL